MKLSLIITTLTASYTAAFAPATVERTRTSLDMDRRAAFGQITAAGAAIVTMPAIASADGAVSKATIGRSRGIYGSRIAALQSAVDAGDFAAVANEKNAFILFNSGVYAKDKGRKSAAVSATNEIFAAIRAQDKTSLKSAFSAYRASNNIDEMPDVSNNDGQGFSNDYDYRARTKAGAIYQR